MSDATGMNGMTTFVKTIPYNFYAILTIIMILVVCLTKPVFVCHGTHNRSYGQAVKIVVDKDEAAQSACGMKDKGGSL